MGKVKAIEDFEGVCFKCLKKKDIFEKFSLYRSDYGSSFDNNYTHLQICSDCKPNGIEEWFDENPEVTEHYTKYKFENNIIDFVETFPLEGQELFWNRCAYGACADTMESQDWIDDKLGVLPDEVYEEEYGMYSPRQIKAYKDRFPTCEHPVNRVWNDDSKGCWCPFGAIGNYNQRVDRNVSIECFGCIHYKKRETPIKEMDNETYQKYEMYIRGKQFNHLFESEEEVE